MTWGTHCTLCGMETCRWVEGEHCEGRRYPKRVKARDEYRRLPWWKRMNFIRGLGFVPVNWGYRQWLVCLLGGDLRPDPDMAGIADGWQCDKCGRAHWRHTRVSWFGWHEPLKHWKP